MKPVLLILASLLMAPAAFASGAGGTEDSSTPMLEERSDRTAEASDEPATGLPSRPAESDGEGRGTACDRARAYAIACCIGQNTPGCSSFTEVDETGRQGGACTPDTEMQSEQILSSSCESIRDGRWMAQVEPGTTQPPTAQRPFTPVPSVQATPPQPPQPGAQATPPQPQQTPPQPGAQATPPQPQQPSAQATPPQPQQPSAQATPPQPGQTSDQPSAQYTPPRPGTQVTPTPSAEHSHPAPTLEPTTPSAQQTPAQPSAQQTPPQPSAQQTPPVAEQVTPPARNTEEPVGEQPHEQPPVAQQPTQTMPQPDQIGAQQPGQVSPQQPGQVSPQEPGRIATQQPTQTMPQPDQIGAQQPGQVSPQQPGQASLGADWDELSERASALEQQLNELSLAADQQGGPESAYLDQIDGLRAEAGLIVKEIDYLQLNPEAGQEQGEAANELNQQLAQLERRIAELERSL